MDEIARLIARVIAQSDAGERADLVLRRELKNARLPQSASRRAAEWVFAFYRWRGLLENGVKGGLETARALDLRFRKSPQSFSDDELRRAFPDWLFREMDVTRELLVAFQTAPPLWLRARRGQGAALAKKLGDCSSPGGTLSDALRYTGPKDLFCTGEFHAGEFEIQDISSQIVGLLCDPLPSETWWDACAGEGGKTLHLSDLMRNKGLIWASDRSARRLNALKRRAARAGIFNYRAVAWDGTEALPTKTRFHGALIDAPCSGVGTWGRNPHARWSTTAKDVAELSEVQKRLVLNAAVSVRPGGKLIYAVCSLTRAETDAVADFCSQQLPGFEPMPLPVLPNAPPEASARKWIWPQSYGGNGMFVAAWQRVR